MLPAKTLTFFSTLIALASATLHYPDVPFGNGTRPDAAVYNVLRCLQIVGIANSTMVGMATDGFYHLKYNNSSQAKDAMLQGLTGCTSLYGPNDMWASTASDYYDNDVQYYGTIGDLITSTPGLPAPGRYQPSTLSKTEATISNDTVVRRGQVQGYYYGLMAEDKSCTNHELFVDATDMCQDNNMNSFASYVVENPNIVTLYYESWPHHRCSKGDSRTFSVPSKSKTACTKRKAYSWFGTLSGDSCYTSESKRVACAASNIDEWNAAFKLNNIIAQGKF
ncbi:hypothetical protein KAFR_0C05240 [Kazachstania africana CBS 2517]|uniref:Uncharacterized protein n=1 Tax=Kazachstania africana (strain ATCC 22294 / BCRC 22015 / CBS 2517 / CECT 1963 / NBRC 1671 / NRRL Y-8276) TaxID=1071382 RepID=H2AT15_KAZAF|nr:hypothetical protein KAFR_0C05240 [Kazachstania africana CBS 2517]CCF57515.1 hypothetical protein KAFR_0C05240 [Kazachstania africana CBS 2517]